MRRVLHQKMKTRATNRHTIVVSFTSWQYLVFVGRIPVVGHPGHVQLRLSGALNFAHGDWSQRAAGEGGGSSVLSFGQEARRLVLDGSAQMRKPKLQMGQGQDLGEWGPLESRYFFGLRDESLCRRKQQPFSPWIPG